MFRERRFEDDGEQEKGDCISLVMLTSTVRHSRHSVPATCSHSLSLSHSNLERQATSTRRTAAAKACAMPAPQLPPAWERDAVELGAEPPPPTTHTPAAGSCSTPFAGAGANTAEPGVGSSPAARQAYLAAELHAAQTELERAGWGAIRGRSRGGYARWRSGSRARGRLGSSRLLSALGWRGNGRFIAHLLRAGRGRILLCFYGRLLLRLAWALLFNLASNLNSAALDSFLPLTGKYSQLPKSWELQPAM
ncbi:hypothetical protein B0H16DRAFT_1476787 [Mycena metata]|uniref:Uncharacterized protein n=1 Tax=Mycena metata TaxID=1033252 RepID=A0AAD7HAJ0_9AGAR|nr:hypothetical protein B0H16DRAFT_1476787 [Mycena metata]